MEKEHLNLFLLIVLIAELKRCKKISFKIANSLLVKTAIAEDQLGRVAMAIGNNDSKINEQKLSFLLGHINLSKGSIYKSYDEEKVIEYMKGKSIEIEVDIGQGVKV